MVWGKERGLRKRLEIEPTFSLEVSVLSDIKPFRNLTFYNVLAQQDSFFVIFQAFALRDIKWQRKKAVT